MNMSNSSLIKPITLKHRLIALAIRSLVGLLGSTWRFQVSDKTQITCTENEPGPVIWAFWHNRVLGATIASRKFCRHRHGSVLTSPSNDGAILAQTIRYFGQDAVRGSSSKRGGRALLELERVLASGGDVAITPDGPRGPRYRMSGGLARLAARSARPVMPVAVETNSCWRLNSWDGFIIPKPGAMIRVDFRELVQVPASADLESERQRLEQILNDGTVMQ